MRRFVSSIFLWGFLFSAGCQAKIIDIEATPEIPPSLVTEPTTTSMPASPPQGDVQVTPSPPTLEDSRLQSLIEKAKADLAQRLGISANEIVLVEATSVTWPNASLGCPQPGMVYAEMITPGYWILLEASGKQHPYHTDMESQIILCPEEDLPSFPVKPGEIDDGQPWMPP